MANKKGIELFEKFIKKDKELQELLKSEAREELPDVLLAVSNLVKQEGNLVDKVKIEKYKEDLIIKGFGKSILEIIKDQTKLLNFLSDMLANGKVEFDKKSIMKLAKDLVQKEELNKKLIPDRIKKVYILLNILIYSGLRSFSVPPITDIISIIVKEFLQSLDLQKYQEKILLLNIKSKIDTKINELLNQQKNEVNDFRIIDELLNIKEEINEKLKKVDILETKSIEQEKKQIFETVAQNVGKYLPPSKQDKFFELLSEAVDIYYEKMRELKGQLIEDDNSKIN